jgi:hypothetical protein
VPAEVGVERLADFIDLESIADGLKLGYEYARAVPPEISPVDRRARVLRHDFGHGFEVVTIENLFPNFRQFLLRRLIIEYFVDSNQNVACTGL